ncbi:MAG TPA: PKD domain-containing protein [Thermoanaerobaculaceae bacterium]|nr:PKD domain-containing protein [Thermoanaerobaculaceae bacterium]HPS78575.1 PKD domain-containing protein [Thermoanaerobaculaceae bacterium]
MSAGAHHCRVQGSLSIAIAAITLLFVPWLEAQGPLEAQAVLALNPNPPASAVRLVFIHHSTGEAWLGDDHGGLGLALRTNNYFVSDTNYGWMVGGDVIGDRTDIGNWWEWFVGPTRDAVMSALYAQTDQSCGYTRMDSTPAGINQIVMFKSCFPNSNLGGEPNDLPTTGSNPLRGQDSGSEHHTVANAKGIYNDLLPYFTAHQEKLFVVIAAPPLRDEDTSPEAAANARAFNNWLVNDWLDGYAHHNVFVFDFFNVLTSNGGNVDTNDLGSTAGNHHRYRNGVIEHVTNQGSNYSRYPSGDSHPTAAGDQKATGEYLPLLNIAYNCWKGLGSCPGPLVTCDIVGKATGPTSGVVGQAVSFDGTVSSVSSSCTGSLAYDWNFGDGSAHATAVDTSHVYQSPGTYTWQLTVRMTNGSMTASGQITITDPPIHDDYAYVVPSVAHSGGAAGTNWRTDVGVVNTASQSVALQLTFYDSVTGLATPATHSLGSMQSVEWRDILTSKLGFTQPSSVKGTLLVTSTRPLAVTSRTYNQESATRTYGQSYPALVVAYPGGREVEVVTNGHVGFIPLLKKNSAFRTNIGFVNLGSTPCTIWIQLVGPNGIFLGNPRTLSADGRRWKQEDDIFAKSSAGNRDAAYARIEAQTADCRAWAYASVIDQNTGDPTTFPVVLP